MFIEDRKLVWKGGIPVQLNLHNSEVTTVPAPPPSLISAPRNGYLPLLVPIVKPHFQSALPIGQDTGWFEYDGLPLKWHIPIGVLFDLLCFEPTRPWNLTVHFRGYPSELLPYEGEDAMKWSFINSLKEASYVMYGSTKHVMNLSQPDQANLWRSVVQGDLESYDRVCFRFAPSLGTSNPSAALDPEAGDAAATSAIKVSSHPLKIPFRLYVRRVRLIGRDSLEASTLKSWDAITYFSRPVDVRGGGDGGGVVLTFWEALQKIEPSLFAYASELPDRDPSLPCPLIWEDDSVGSEENPEDGSYSDYPYVVTINPRLFGQQGHYLNGTMRIQGIEPSPELPIDWIAHNLCGPDHFVHVCVLIATS